jgi:DNA polymerase III delta prime subunit
MIEEQGRDEHSFDTLLRIPTLAVRRFLDNEMQLKRSLDAVYQDAYKKRFAVLEEEAKREQRPFDPEVSQLDAAEIAAEARERAARNNSEHNTIPFPDLNHQRLKRLRDEFGLGQFEVFVLLYCAASMTQSEVISFNKRFTGTYNPSPYLAFTLFTSAFDQDVTEHDAVSYFAAGRALRKWRLIELTSDTQNAANHFHASIVIDEHIAQFVLGGNQLPKQLDAVLEPLKVPKLSLKKTQRDQARQMTRAWGQPLERNIPRTEWPILQLLHKGGAVMFETKAGLATRALSQFTDSFFELRLDLLDDQMGEVSNWLNRELRLHNFAIVVDVNKLLGRTGLESLLVSLSKAFHGLLVLCVKEPFELPRAVVNIEVSKATVAEQRGAWARALRPALRLGVPFPPNYRLQFFPEGVPIPEGYDYSRLEDGSIYVAQYAMRMNRVVNTGMIRNFKIHVHRALNHLVGQYDLDEVVLTRAAELALNRFSDWFKARVLPPAVLKRLTSQEAVAQAEISWQRFQEVNKGRMDRGLRSLDLNQYTKGTAAVDDENTMTEFVEEGELEISESSEGVQIESWECDVLGQTDLDLDEAQTRIDKLFELAWEAVKEIIMPRIGQMAQLVKPKGEWEQLILDREELWLLKTMSAHVRQRNTVYNEWGWTQAGSYGFGISALFSGPSGTGKTMAAEVIAKSLNLDLIKIDLSSVVSKYIGETEKNLSKVFDAAESGGSILFFDEGDALFGKRGEVTDSSDRYANVEVAYLLQRMEAFRGLAILTTNLENSLDTAFLRRLRFVVRFKVPKKEQRRKIWETVFPKVTPLADDLNYDSISNFEFSGGNIRKVALNATFTAAERGDGHRVSMTDIWNAAMTEIRVLKRLLRDEEMVGWENWLTQPKPHQQGGPPANESNSKDQD